MPTRRRLPAIWLTTLEGIRKDRPIVNGYCGPSRPAFLALTGPDPIQVPVDTLFSECVSRRIRCRKNTSFQDLGTWQRDRSDIELNSRVRKLREWICGAGLHDKSPSSLVKWTRSEQM